MIKPDSDKLRKLGFARAGASLWTRVELQELRDKISATDMLISDIDECMVPFIAQAEAGKYALQKSLATISTPAQALGAARMAALGADILISKTRQSAARNSRNSLLIRKFEKFIHGAPMSSFSEAADRLVKLTYPGAPETLRAFTSRDIPAGMISLGLDFFINPFREYLFTEHNVTITFSDCTATLEKDGLFAGYDPGKTLLCPGDKTRIMRARAAELKSKSPLVIGHDRDDEAMLGEARASGGAALGFNPIPEVYQHLDAAVFAPDWLPLAALAEESFIMNKR